MVCYYITLTFPSSASLHVHRHFFATFFFFECVSNVPSCLGGFPIPCVIIVDTFACNLDELKAK